MGKEKIKQHFVPQCYLEQWAIPDKHQVYVYNKKVRKSYPANILDVAEERYFYDIDFTGILTEDDLKKYGYPVCDPKRLDDGQYIENFFANIVENDFKTRLLKIIYRVSQMNLWEIKNCSFLTEEDKFHLSFHLALQYIRVRSVRSGIAESNDCLSQALVDMGVPEEIIERHTVSMSQLPYIHGKMILDKEHLEKRSQSFFSLSWILHVNRTTRPFFTSDSPIGTEEHAERPYPFISMAGLNSQGVEVYFPISPNLMLLMFDGEYHKRLQGYDRRIIELYDEEAVKYCNSRCALYSDSCVISNKNDFSIINEMLVKDPKVFDQPRTVLHWGGNTYTPRK